ncbi:eukaryotic translation initiation factor 3 subunit G-B-like [Anoplophora glabripennis]|uniref:eukaryotic translation initiation factor 3 subunit G-B-like n=1 Tax=Anoplophora glabripennis TaxID=217634 RepID=UPI000873D562|nr:eukaryotic translation initiation factor 3 subunit G-B-like [Anoplophora glabripennis]
MSEESCVVRIVNLDETFTNETLKNFILLRCQLYGDIKNIYLKRDDSNKIFYGYIVFEHSYDAAKVIQSLNGYVSGTNQFEVELIGPNLKYRIFPENEEYGELHYCGICRGRHHSFECPLKNVISARENLLRRRRFLLVGTGSDHLIPKVSKEKDVPPNTKPKDDGANRAWRDGTSYSNIYISNIHYSTTESDLAKLVEPFGPRKKLHLAKDKETGRVRGFAYVNFKFRSDADKAISELNGTTYRDRVLKVEWSKS